MENESESDSDWNLSDTIDWSDWLDIEEFSGQQVLKYNVPDSMSPNDLFSQLFGDSVIDAMVTEMNWHAREKLADTPHLEKWKDIANHKLKAYFGICIIMGINNVPRISCSCQPTHSLVIQASRGDDEKLLWRT